MQKIEFNFYLKLKSKFNSVKLTSTTNYPNKHLNYSA